MSHTLPNWFYGIEKILPAVLAVIVGVYLFFALFAEIPLSAAVQTLFNLQISFPWQIALVLAAVCTAYVLLSVATRAILFGYLKDFSTRMTEKNHAQSEQIEELKSSLKGLNDGMQEQLDISQKHREAIMKQYDLVCETLRGYKGEKIALEVDHDKLVLQREFPKPKLNG